MLNANCMLYLLVPYSRIPIVIYNVVIKPPQAEAPKARTTKINSEKNFLDKVIMQKLATIYNH